MFAKDLFYDSASNTIQHKSSLSEDSQRWHAKDMIHKDTDPFIVHPDGSIVIVNHPISLTHRCLDLGTCELNLNINLPPSVIAYVCRPPDKIYTDKNITIESIESMVRMEILPTILSGHTTIKFDIRKPESGFHSEEANDPEYEEANRFLTKIFSSYLPYGHVPNYQLCNLKYYEPDKKWCAKNITPLCSIHFFKSI